MPIYEVNGKRANVKDASVNKFLGQYPDAKLIDNEPYSIVRQGSTPRQSSIQKQTGTQVEEYPVQQPSGGLTGGFTTFQDGTSGFIPAMKMPDIKIEQPKPGLPKSQITKGTPFENKTLLDSTQETVRSMPVSPEAHFDSEQSVYEQNQDWIKEVQNDPSMSPEVKQSLIDDYNKNIRISNNTIEYKDLPLYAKKWLDNNKVSVPTTVYVPGSPMFGGGQYVESTKQANTPEQIAFIKDFIANTPQGQDLVNKQKAYVEYLENSISDVETRVPELKKKYWQEQYDLSRSHPYPMGKTNGKAETDAARKDYIEKSNAISERMSALNLAEKNAEDQKKLLAAVRDGDLNVLSQFGKQIGRDFWEMSGDIGTLGIRPMMQSLYESSDVKGLQDRMDKGELTNEDRLAMSAMANNQAYQELMGDRRTIAQEVASGITQSAPFMVNFATTGGIGKAVTGGAKELLKQGIKRNAINAIKQGAKIGTEKLGARLAGFGLNVADATGRASVMAAISPHTYRDMFDNMTGQVTYGYDEEGKPYYLGNVEQMDIANALFNAWRSNTIENVSEFSGFGMEKGQVALSRLLKQRVPEVAKALSFGSTRNQFFQGVNKAMRAAGFNGTVNEFLEEQVATVLHSFFEDGQAQWSDLVDPRQQFITYLTVAAIGSGSAIMNTGGNQLMKHGAKKAYNNAFQDFGTEFYNSQNNDIAGQFADAVRNGTIEEKQSALADIVNSDLFNDKQKLSALNLYRAGLTYESYEGAKEAHVEEATQEIPAMIEENANPEMDAVVSATIAGMDTPVQIIGGNIVQNEDGTINREQSDKEIYYVDADGNRQVISIQYVDNITENVPTQDAIAQVTEQVAAPIIAQQENEEVRPYEAGETVRFSPDGNTSLVGQIIGQNEDGSYILQEVTTGQQVSVQPRQIINEDNLQGVENGSPVIYTNQNGEQVQDIVATSPDLYAQGLIAFENGDVVKIENVVGLAGNNEQISQFENNEKSGRPRNIENSTIENNIRFENQEHTNKNTLATNEPRVFEIEEGLSAVENADGTYALDKQFAKSELKKADSLVKRLNEDYSDNGLVFETVQFPRKDASNPFEKPLWGVVARIQQELPIQEQSETPSQNRENEHLWNVAENSDSPIDIASAYNEAMQTAGEEALDEWQKQLLGKKINRVSFERFGDRNLINGATARSWFNRKGEESTSGSIDIIAQELGVDVQSIIDFIVDHPSNRIKKGNDLTQSLNTRFKEIAQSITGREVGGIESNSGKLFLSTLEYAANNTPTEVETEFMQSDVISNIPNSVEFFLSDYMRLDEISDFNQFRDAVEEADKQGYFMFPLESKDKETILNYINNAEQQANAIQGIGENVSDESIIENVEQPTIQEQIAQTETGRFVITETKDGKYQVIDTETNQPKSRTYDNRKSAKKQQHALYEALSQTNKTIEELESYPYFSKESQDQAKRALSILDSFDPSNITLQDANKIIDIISNKPVPFYQVQQALDTKSIMIGNQDYYTPDYLKKYILYSTKDIPAQGSISEKIAQAEAETNTNPTEAQKEAGNYKKGKVTIQGLDISIEQPKGSVRSGVDANGKEWSIAINNTYGYIRGTEGKDGDHIDVFLGENPESPALFVVDQVNQDGNFDEHKVMLGFESIEEAREAYLSNYEEGWQGLGNITQSDMDTFKKWAKNDTRKIKPFAEYKDIQDSPQFQSSEKAFTPISKKTFNELVDWLKQTGLARDVITDKVAFDEKLNEIINDNATAKQVRSEDDTSKMKEKQLATVIKYNPAPNNHNTWVRTTDDILTAEEAFRETLASNDSMYPDFTAEDMQRAIDNGEVTVYSSKPIKKGVFITPSLMNAEEYAGGGKVYSKTIKLTDAAWIDESEGQYTPVKFMKTNMGDVYGFVTPDGTVYLDSTRMNANTPIHEFGHLWVDLIQQQNPDLYQTGENLILDSVYWDKVQNDPYYSTLTQEQQINEALAMAIGDKGEFIINDKSIGHKLLDWIQSVWEWIGSKIGIRDLNSSQLQNITLSQFTELAAADLLGGKDIANIPAGPEVLNDIRFQSVNDVADATDSTMTEEMRNELDKRIKNLWFRIREAYEDRHLAVKEFLDVLRENGTEVAEYDDFYNKVTHINGAIDAQLEQYNKKYQKPLNKAISELEKAGFDYRDIENYAILKHGLERNAWMKQDLINQYMENNPEATPQQIGTFELNLPNDFSGITAVEKEVGKHAEWFINDFEEKAGKDLIDNLWKRVNDATSYSLNKQLKGQLIDKKTIEDLKNRYDYYIPLRGHDAEVAEDKWDYSPDMGAYFVAPLLKARGRKTRSESPFAYIASMAQSAINSANRNILNQTILRLALKDKSGLLNVNKAWYEKTGERDGKPVYEVLSPEYNEDPDTYRKNIEEFEERMAKLADAGLAVQSGKKLDIGGLFIKRKQADQHEVHVFQNGTEYVVYINANPAVARAINGSNAKDLHKDLRFFAKVSRQMAANFTTRNPIFVASNFSRDYIFSSSILPVKENAKYALQFQRNMPRSADALQRYVRGKADLNKQQDRYLNEYILNGAKTGFSHILELQKVQKQIERDIKQGGKKGVLDYSVRPILEGLEAMNEIAENMSRLSVYITSREQGRSITQSVTDAKEVTVNFNRSGAGGLGAAWFRSLYLFVNAGVQALSNFAKVAQKNKAKTAVLISSYAMSGFAIMPMLSYLIGGDDGLDEYFKISDWERQNNLCIYTGNGFIKIPLPHELRVFHKMGDEIYQSTFGKKDVTQSLLDTALGFSDLIPANPMGAVDGSWADIMPDATKPFFQLAANRNFTGSRITNEWADPNKPGYLRVRTNKKGEPFAPAFLVKLAETLENTTGGDGVEKGLISFNPDVVNHLMRGYFGGLYNMGMQGLDLTSKTYDWTKTGEFKLKARETPAKTFYTSESDLQTSNSGLNTKYFKLVDDTQETIRKVKGYKDQVADGELSVTDFYSKIENLNVPKANELYGHIKQIKKYESALKELDGQDQKDLEKIIADLKKQSIEINNSLSK